MARVGSSGSGIRIGCDELRALEIIVNGQIGSAHGLHRIHEPTVTGKVDLDLRDCGRQQIRDISNCIPERHESSPGAIAVDDGVDGDVDGAAAHAGVAASVRHKGHRDHAHYEYSSCEDESEGHSEARLTLAIRIFINVSADGLAGRATAIKEAAYHYSQVHHEIDNAENDVGDHQF